jgi:hypothetical protein
MVEGWENRANGLMNGLMNGLVNGLVVWLDGVRDGSILWAR